MSDPCNGADVVNRYDKRRFVEGEMSLIVQVSAVLMADTRIQAQ